MSAAAWAQFTITTGTISGSPFCGGGSVSVPYTVSVPANAGNIFTAELSDNKGSFTAAVAIGTLSATGSGTITATIPLGSKSGTKYLIRVKSSNPVVIGTPNTKNLKVNPKPSGTTTTGISACAITLNWKSQDNAASFKVRYKKTADASYSNTIDVGNVLTHAFTGLSGNTSYDMQVRAACANGELSDWKKVTASTSISLVPTGGGITNIHPVTTITTNWDDMPCASSYKIQYRPLYDPNWLQTTSTTSDKYITGVMPGTFYEIQFATVVGDNTSAWTVSYVIETAYFRLGDESGTSILGIFPNPTTGNFNISIDAAVDNSNALLSVENILGQNVYTKNISLTTGTNNLGVSLPNISSGLYMLRVKSNDQTFESKLLVK